MPNAKSCLRLFALACAGLLIFALQGAPARADQDDVSLFSVLPPEATGPEGLTIGPDSNLYVTTYGYNASGPATGPGRMYVIGQNGHLIRQLSIPGTTPHLLGLAFHPTTHKLLVIDSGGSKVYSVNPVNGAATVFMTVTGSAGLNALTFDAAGNVYVSDSFQGIIWKTGPAGGAATAWVTNALLLPNGVPPFGANGLGFNKAGNILFVANTANDQIIQIPVTAGTPGTPTIFVNSINGADGLILDNDDNLWVAANQSDKIVVLDKTGKLINQFGGFRGVDRNGVPQGLLFPASLVVGRGAEHGNNHVLYVTNLALDIRLFGLAQSPDSQWAAMVKHYTISRIELNEHR